MRVCQRTHQGRVRSSNQDCLLVDGRVYGVADGMGGHQGGETASRVAVQVLKNALRGKLPDRRALEVGMEAANRRVYDMACGTRGTRIATAGLQTGLAMASFLTKRVYHCNLKL